MSAAVCVDRELLLSRFPLPRIPDDAGKEERGRLLLIGGSRELAGAAILAGEAALRAGAGKLQIGTAASVAPAIGSTLLEARVIPHPETADGCIAEDGIAPLLGWARNAQAVLLGCGLVFGAPLSALLEGLARDAAGPLVLDAAALQCLSKVSSTERGWRHGAVLLPHSREMARLLDVPVESVESDPGRSASEAARRFGAFAMVKGPVSQVAAPDGRVFAVRGGGVGLATSGSGDVLAGIVGGLCARGADPLTALLWGIWLHAEAGRLLSDRVGRVGFLASELPPLIPSLLP